jgi:hypothetical protein
MIHKLYTLSILLALPFCFLCSCEEKPSLTVVHATPTKVIPVTITPQGMMRDGKPYVVQGVGGDERLPELAARGANSIRTWSTNGLEKILDHAHDSQLTVSAGIWLESECSWFSYKNPAHRAKQLDRVGKEVTEFREHPALLAWGLGNECDGDGQNIDYWKQLDALARMVREIDPHHPTFTAIAGSNPARIRNLNEHTPHLDFLGVNTYGSVFSIREKLKKEGWTRPWMLTEWGPRGFWECKRSPVDSPLEQTSTEKAAMLRDAYTKALHPRDGFLGNYAFVWGWKFESTATWFGLYTHEGDTIASVDVLEEMWSGRKPLNQAPAIQPMRGVPQTPLAPSAPFTATIEASDPDGDALTWHWAVLPDLQGHHHNTNKKFPAAIPNTIVQNGSANVTVTSPKKPGVYRLYVWVKDGKGHVATHNMPFAVKK